MSAIECKEISPFVKMGTNISKYTSSLNFISIAIHFICKMVLEFACEQDDKMKIKVFMHMH